MAVKVTTMVFIEDVEEVNVSSECHGCQPGDRSDSVYLQLYLCQNNNIWNNNDKNTQL